MARYRNPMAQNPWARGFSNLGLALFGDPYGKMQLQQGEQAMQMQGMQMEKLNLEMDLLRQKAKQKSDFLARFGKGATDLTSAVTGDTTPPTTAPATDLVGAVTGDTTEQPQGVSITQLPAASKTFKPAIHQAPAQYAEWIKKYAAAHGVPEGALTELIYSESSFDPNAQGAPITLPDGSVVYAKGLAQAIPSTAAQYHLDPTDPEASINFAAQYLSDLLKQQGGDPRKALAAYKGAKSEGNI